MVKKINASEFDEAMTGISVIDFSATWCGPCNMMAPVLEEISDELNNIKFFNVDVDQNNALAAKYEVVSIPALLVLKDGVKQDMLVGFKPKNILKNELGRFL